MARGPFGHHEHSLGGAVNMAIDVFISCSTRDRDVAEAIGRTLESRGVSYWSPLELGPGQPAKAPGAFRMVVLAFSARANKSRRVRTEIQHAIDRQMPIVTLCVEDVAPRQPFDRLAESAYWRRGRRSSLPEHLEQVVYWVIMLLARLDMGSDARTLAPAKPRRRGRTGAGPAEGRSGFAPQTPAAGSEF